MNTFEHMQATLLHEQRTFEPPKRICHIKAPAIFTLTAHHIVQGLMNFPSNMTKNLYSFFASKQNMLYHNAKYSIKLRPTIIEYTNKMLCHS